MVIPAKRNTMLWTHRIQQDKSFGPCKRGEVFHHQDGQHVDASSRSKASASIRALSHLWRFWSFSSDLLYFWEGVRRKWMEMNYFVTANRCARPFFLLKKTPSPAAWNKGLLGQDEADTLASLWWIIDQPNSSDWEPASWTFHDISIEYPKKTKHHAWNSLSGWQRRRKNMTLMISFHPHALEVTKPAKANLDKSWVSGPQESLSNIWFGLVSSDWSPPQSFQHLGLRL